MTHLRLASVALAVALAAVLLPAAAAAGEVSAADCNKVMAAFKKSDPGLARFLSGAAGYAVFPSVGKGGIGVGGAYGKGLLFVGGKAVGRTSLTQVSVGLQLGGQAYSEIIFFETEKTLQAFKGSQFALAAQASAVAVTAGASANAGYRDGVAVFTQAKGGLMYEASVGGQKFKYEPGLK